jgi:DNA-binding XRE family transcriptional regulator
MFGDEHLGRAVALRRMRRDMTQVDLAKAIEVNKATMNRYESGKSGMSDVTLGQIAAVLQCDTLEIWDEAFGIFRYNVLRVRAESLGVTAETLAGRERSAPTLDGIHARFRTLGDTVWAMIVDVLTFLRPDRAGDPQHRVSGWGVLVNPPDVSKATRFRLGNKGARKPKASSPQE